MCAASRVAVRRVVAGWVAVRRVAEQWTVGWQPAGGMDRRVHTTRRRWAGDGGAQCWRRVAHSTRVNSTQLKSTQVNSSRLKSTQVDSSQLNSSQATAGAPVWSVGKECVDLLAQPERVLRLVEVGVASEVEEHVTRGRLARNVRRRLYEAACQIGQLAHGVSARQRMGRWGGGVGGGAAAWVVGVMGAVSTGVGGGCGGERGWGRGWMTREDACERGARGVGRACMYATCRWARARPSPA
jgi:hypothetical protein